MPRVGDRVFPYTPEGEHAARLYAKRMGLHVEHEDSAETAYSPFLSRRNPVMPEMKIEGTREHFVGRTDDDDRAKYGRWGYADETKRQHFDRMWDRDWDEDWRGRQWHPRSRKAGRR
jgi:hypothetical protein